MPQCPEGCCNGTEILCVSIPCPVNIVVLGIDLTLELPCIRLTSGTPLSSAQVSQLLQALTSIISTLGSVLPTA